MAGTLAEVPSGLPSMPGGGQAFQGYGTGGTCRPDSRTVQAEDTEWPFGAGEWETACGVNEGLGSGGSGAAVATEPPCC